MRALTQHRLYDAAFGQLRYVARKFKMTLKAVAQTNHIGGKVLRRGTPGAFGRCHNRP